MLSIQILRPFFRHFLKAFAIVMALSLPPSAYAKPLCAFALGANPSLSLTENYIAYLIYLTDTNTLTTADLEKMLNESRHQSQLVHPIDQKILVNSALAVHYENLKEYLDHKPNLEQVLTQIQNYLNQKLNVIVEKNKTSNETKAGEVEMRFLRIERPHTTNDGKTVMLSFEVMETLVTQAMWMKIMGQNPSNNPKGGDYPVENLTFFSAAEFADRLSKQKGLPEVYRHRRNVTFAGSAEAGDLEAKQGPLIVDAPNEDIYETEGYRLPTKEEMVFLLTHYERIEKRPIKEFIWFRDNSEGETQPVAMLSPLSVQGQTFFDLAGNVIQWLHTHKYDVTNFGWNYFGSINGISYAYGLADFSIESLPLARSASPNLRDPYVGFRLVRSLPKSSR